ncbi:MAG: hypothetical protein JXA25_00615 [Anaerolineales bacterium]|nr:hypothetical protein [Anaerolineales bacterium]
MYSSLLAGIRGEPTGVLDVSSTLPVIWLLMLSAVAVLFVMIGLLAALAILRGKDFRYPVLGRWLDVYMMDQA